MNRFALFLALVALCAPHGAGAGGLVPNPVGIYGGGTVSQPIGIAIRANGDIYVVRSFTRRVEKFSPSGSYQFGWGSLGSGPGQFQYPTGIAVDSAGTLYVVDTNLSRVQRFSPAGALLGEFGAPGTGNGQFADPHGIAVDAAGHVYVIDTFNHRVQKFTPGGVYLAQWGSEGTAGGRFSYPYGIAVDSRGDVYVADTYNHRIQKFDAAGTFLRQWGVSGTGDGEFTFPVALHVDPGGNVWVADEGNHRIQRFTSTGVFVAKWGTQGSGTEQFFSPQGIAVDPAGDVHVADTNNHRIQVFRGREGTGHEALLAWGNVGTGNNEFSQVHGVAVAPDGFVYVADRGNQRIQKFTSFGAWAGTWGTVGGGNGQFLAPIGVAVDADGFVYVTDLNTSRVQKFTGAGAYVAQWGSAGTGPGQFSGLWDIATDATGHVYVVDDHRVQKFTTAGAFVTQWSSSNASGIGTDPEGFVYVACTTEHVIRKYAPDGTFVLAWGSFGSGLGQFDHPFDVACDAAGSVFVGDNSNRIQRFTRLGGWVAEWGETGSALRQMRVPQLLAVDAAGSVYASELLNTRIQKFASPAELISIVDVPGDEGGWARVTFTRSSAEAPGSGGAPSEYRIQRYQMSPPALVTVATVPVDGVTTTALVHTGGHATDRFTGMSEYMITASLPVPGSFPLQWRAFGFSVDDLAPPTPSPFTGVYAPSATALHWSASPAADLAEYRLHRGVTSGFAVAPSSLIHASPDTGYADPGPAGRHYKLVAADTSGNASAPAILGPEETVAAPGGDVALEFRLEAMVPNPSSSGSVVARFTLPDAAPARLELIDVAGRSRWSREIRGAGAHALRLSGSQALPAGIYLVRLTWNDRALVRRAVVLNEGGR